MSFTRWKRSTSAPPPPPQPRPPSAADRRRARDRRERIATTVLAGIAAQLESVSDADVKYSVQVADMLIQELDKGGGR